MSDVLHASLIYRLLASIYRWFSRQWKESRIIRAFLRLGNGEGVSDSSIFTKLWAQLHRFLCFVFEKLRLNKLLEGSVFKRSCFWCGAAMVCAPILPTMYVLALAVAGTGSVILTFACDREKKHVFSPVNRFILLYAFVYFISIFTSVTVMGSLKGGILTVFFTMFAIVLQNAVTTKKQLEYLVIGFVAAGFLVSAGGVVQYVFGIRGTETWLDSDMFSDISLRVYSTLQNPNVLAEYLLLVIPITAACAITGKDVKRKVIYWCALAVMLVCMVLTFSRGGWLGLLFSAAIFLILLDRRFILPGIVGLVGLMFVMPETILSRFASIGNTTDSSTSYRVAIWMGTLAMLRDYWFSGIGPGQTAFRTVYPAYSYSDVAAPHAHNLFLQITCDTGIVGIALFIILLIQFFRTVCSAISKEQDKASCVFQKAAVASVCGFLVQSMTDFSFYNYRVMLLFWVVIALGALFARRSSMPDGV